MVDVAYYYVTIKENEQRWLTLIVSESENELRVYPFFGDMCGYITDVYKDFDDLIDNVVIEDERRFENNTITYYPTKVAPRFGVREFINILESLSKEVKRYQHIERLPKWKAYVFKTNGKILDTAISIATRRGITVIKEP